MVVSPAVKSPPLARLVCLVAALGLALPAAAAQPDLRDLALMWIQGSYRAPLICQVQGSPRRALRTIVIHRAPSRDGRPSSRVIFLSLDAPPGTHCHDVLGRDEPNVVGSLLVTLTAPSHPDTARHDFEERLRRDGAFTFDVTDGTLGIGPTDARPDQLQGHSFRGGTATFSRVRPGSDDAHRLEEFGSRRKLSLRLKAPDGTQLSFPLASFGTP